MVEGSKDLAVGLTAGVLVLGSTSLIEDSSILSFTGGREVGVGDTVLEQVPQEDLPLAEVSFSLGLNVNDSFIKDGLVLNVEPVAQEEQVVFLEPTAGVVHSVIEETATTKEYLSPAEENAISQEIILESLRVYGLLQRFSSFYSEFLKVDYVDENLKNEVIIYLKNNFQGYVPDFTPEA